jgi:hypothetical protein
MRSQTEAAVGIWGVHYRRCSVRCRSSCHLVGSIACSIPTPADTRPLLQGAPQAHFLLLSEIGQLAATNAARRPLAPDYPLNAFVRGPEGRSLDNNDNCKPSHLVVEDELLLRLMAVDIVETAGFEALSAGTADEALAILEARADVRLVFTDVQMPGSMDGLRLAHAVRDRWPRSS